MSKSKLVLATIIAVALAAFLFFDVSQYMTLDYFKSQQADVEQYVASNFTNSVMIFFVSYVIVTALSLPGAAVMTLIAGAIFGLLNGLIIVSFASTLGATLALLTSRFLLRDSIQAKFSSQLQSINEGIEKEGAFYLFTLRLVPVVPFFVINLVMGLTKIPVRTFFWVSQVGMLAGTAVYVNAGTQLAGIESLAGILSPGIIFSFVLLGLFPLITKRVLAAVKSKKVLKAYPKPASFDEDIVVIGAGSAGLVTSYIAAAV